MPDDTTLTGTPEQPPKRMTATAVQMPGFSQRQVARVRDVLARVYALRRATRFYPADHPARGLAVDDVLAALQSYFDEGVDVPFLFSESELFLGEQLLTAESILFDQLIRDLAALGAGSITFGKGLTTREVHAFAEIISAPPEVVEADGGVPAMLAAADVDHILVTEAFVLSDRAEDDLDPRKSAKAAYAGALDLVRELDHAIAAGQPLSAPRIRGAVRSLIDNVADSRAAMLELAGLKSHDEYTFYHSVNVAVLSLALGSAISHDQRFLATLGTGALLHDLGKLAIPPGIINKETPLTSKEWDEIRKHPVYGASMAALTPGLDRGATVIVLEHHMRLDGAGYPPHPESRQHIGSRIVAIADAYDAMTSTRSYSDARRLDEAIEVLMSGAGTALDETLVRIFVRLMGLYPPRSLVRLSTGETAIVLAANEGTFTAPVVRVIADVYGAMVAPRDVDLSALGQAGTTAIVSCIDPGTLNIDVGDFL
jgi:HD-GYP domain-containing protein (c-di-GMP phosphodiesterase class II)